MSVAERRGRWQGGGAADSTGVRQGDPNAGSGILIEPLNHCTRCTRLLAYVILALCR